MTTGGRASASFVRVRRLVPGPIRRAAARLVGDRRAQEVDRELAALARGRQPIVVGPWLGEVGFELLYWVPFVRWFAERHAVAPSRLIVVSRGGAAAWYTPFAVRSHDVLSFMSADEFRARNAERNSCSGEQKQTAVTPFDEEILGLVRRTEGTDAAVLHPSLMYRAFAPYWYGHRPVEWVHRRARFERLEPPAAADIELPTRFTAVKFYENDCFRSTAASRAFVRRTIQRLQEEGPVVSLSTGMRLDDHVSCDPDESGTGGIRDRVRPETNLLVQAAVVARAQRFVGTYGGFAYLAPFYGVPSESYYTEQGAFSLRHLDLAHDAIARTPGAGPLVSRPAFERG